MLNLSQNSFHMVDYYKFPLSVKRDANQTFKSLREVAWKNKETIFIEKDEFFHLYLRGIGGNSIFYFKVSNPEPSKANSRIIYSLDFAPHHITSIGPKRTKAPSHSIIALCSNWLAMLVENDKLKIHPKDTILEQYENEFDGWFEIVDEDADTKTFDAKIQILISNVVTNSVVALKEIGYEDNDDIIEDAEQLKEDIVRLTKRQVFDALKHLYAKLKIKGGWPALGLVFKICKEQMIAMGFHVTVKELGEKLFTLLETYNG